MGSCHALQEYLFVLGREVFIMKFYIIKHTQYLRRVMIFWNEKAIS